MIERICSEDKILSIIIRSSFQTDGIAFFTPEEFSQQLAFMKRGRGHVIAPHVHNTVTRQVKMTNEVLFIRSGRVRVDFYDCNRVYMESRILNKGDVILLVNGGHGLTMLEESEVIEVKQGPYAGEADKTRFQGAKKECIRVREPE